MPQYTRRKVHQKRTRKQKQRGGSNNETPTLENVLGIVAGVGYKKEMLPTSGALSTRSRSNYLTGLYRKKAITEEKAKQDEEKIRNVIEQNDVKVFVLTKDMLNIEFLTSVIQ